MTESMDVSIVIPTRNGGERLGRCLDAIGRQRTARRFETLCIDSESSLDDLAIMRRRPVRIEPIRAAELLYPWIRPSMLYVGNRWFREVRL